MKLLVVLCLFAMSAVSFGSNRNIYDIMYLPSAKTVYGTTDVSFIRSHIYDYGVKTDANSTVAAQQLGFSVMDNLSLTLSANYLKAVSKESGSDSVHTEGLSDPTVSAKYRLMDDAFILDLLGGYTVSTGDLETNSSFTRSNNKSGGPSFNIGAQIGQKTTDFQWAILGRITHHADAKADFGGTNVDIDAYNAYYVEGATLMKLSEVAFFKTSLSFDFTEGFDANTTSNASVSTTALAGEYEYLVATGLLLRGSLAFSNSTTDNVQQFNTWNLNFGATYQF